MFKLAFIFIAILLLVTAEDLSHGAEGTNFEVQKGYSLNTMIDNSGKPAGALYAYLGGKMSQIPSSYSQPAYFSSDLAPGTTALWLNQFTSVSYFVAGVVAALSVWYICWISLAGSKKSIESLEDDAKSGGTEPASPSSSVEKVKSRKRRAIQKADGELNRLASIVLSAVESGECLQKSICLIGSQISDKKGKLADTLLSTLLPTKVQQSDYYIVLKKALRGEISCEKFRCSH